MGSTGISVESYARLASRIYSRGDRFLYGYYNSEQHLIQVKICTAVDKEKARVLLDHSRLFYHLISCLSRATSF